VSVLGVASAIAAYQPQAAPQPGLGPGPGHTTVVRAAAPADASAAAAHGPLDLPPGVKLDLSAAARDLLVE
jgi:hypothetical protein